MTTKDKRFKNRKDNMYFKDEDGKYDYIRGKTHGRKEMNHDIGGKFVLISNEYIYFGKDAIKIPKKLRWIIKKGPGHKSNFSEEQIKKFEIWTFKIIS